MTKSKTVSILFLMFIVSPRLISAEESLFKLDPVLDTTLLATGLGLEVFSYFYEAPELQNPPEPTGLDGLFRFKLNENQDTISTVLTYGLLMAPGILIFDNSLQKEWFSLGVMYTEAFLLVDGTKNLIKSVFPKYRPYVFDSGIPSGDDEYDESFPSGHTSLAFLSAAFLTTVISKTPALKEHTFWVGASSFALASTVGVLRITSGSHHLSDVLVGAAIGSAFGVLIPSLHENSGFGVATGDQIVLSYTVRY